ncbi:DUF1810 domain-containing protein [Cognatishimia activa]|uniref:DUF1810 domain-containing protein n=1 Tax=Cognatishimia activa TaxID=1715691 RepID=A0A975ERS1_9RHOB|nr:DUF1810 family protein [Cognatishimia activa]QTN36978.1 DUF1810 domain-containing protein [Cognatishimia activa]
MNGPNDLERFLGPQELTHAKALSEMRAGLKLSHWIWWEFPQLRGLGTSVKSVKYGLADLSEARFYLAHPLLGPRLVELSMALMAHRGAAPEAVLGPVDARKVQSMATLFSRIDGAPAVFQDILDGFYGGMRCMRTDQMLAS